MFSKPMTRRFQMASRGARGLAIALAALGIVIGILVPAHAAQLTLTWTDTSTNEDGFKVERKTGSTGAYGQLTTLAAEMTGYVDSAVTAGTTYCYRVRAYNSAGDSAYSNEACAAPASATPYTVGVTKAGTGSGTVTSTPSGITCGPTCSTTSAPFDYGTNITLTATPATGSSFTSWNGAGCSGTGTCTFPVNAATTVSATFTLQTFALSVTKAGTGTGTVTSTPTGLTCGPACSGTSASFNYSTTVTLTAAPATGSTFTGWSGACSGTGTCSVSMTQARSVTATFAIQASQTTYTLTVTKSGTGSGTVTSSPTGIECGSACSATIAAGTTVTLTATPATGSVFSGWSGACTGTGTCVVTVDAAKSATATFAPAPTGDSLVAAYGFNEGSGTTTADAAGSGLTGTLSNATWTTSGKHGNALTFDGTSSWVTVTHAPALTLATGLTVTAWVHPTIVTDWRTVVLKETTGDHTYALYAADGTGRPAAHVNLGSQDVQVSAAASLALDTWSHLALTHDGATLRLFVNGSQVGSQAAAGTIVPSTAPLRLGGNSVWGEYFQGRLDDVRLYNRALSVAELQADLTTPGGGTTPPPPPTYALTITKVGTGAGTVTSPTGIACGTDCTESYPSGTAVTLAAAPAAGSTFTGWGGACMGTGSCTVTMDGAQSVTATFAAQHHTLTVTKAGTGSGTLTSSPAGIACGTSCAATYSYSTPVTLTAAPATGSTFTGWSGACSGTAACTVTMTAAQGVTATFSAAATPLTVTTVTADKPGAQPVGTAITFTASVTGGTAPQQCKWFVTTDPTWASYTVLQTWQACTTTVPWTPTVAKSYQVGVWARSSGTAADLPQATKGLAVTITPRQTTVRLSADQASPQRVGTPVTFTATASTGTAPYTYKWWVTTDNWRTWAPLRDWGGNTYTWTPATPGPYQVGVWARSHGNSADAPETSAGRAFTVTPLPVTVSATPASPQRVGTAVTLTATVTGGTAPQCKWFATTDLTWASYSVLRDWQACTTTVPWTPTTPGPYQVGVWARSSGSTADAPQGSGGRAFTVTGSTPPSVSGQ